MTNIALQRTNIRDLSPEEIQQLIDKNRAVYTQFYDAAYTDSMESNLFQPLNAVYFRAKMVNFEEYPEPMNNDKPLIFISNHSGMAFP